MFEWFEVMRKIQSALVLVKRLKNSRLMIRYIEINID